MSRYFSTFAPGLKEVVETALKKRLEAVDIDLLLDGLVVYKSCELVDKIKALRFFNNSFFLLFFFEDAKNKSIPSMIKTVLNNPGKIPTLPKGILKGARTFRIITSRENQLISVDKGLLARAEELFSRKLNLRVNRSKPDIELWFLLRSEGYGFLGLRLTRTPNYGKTLQKGELRPELAHLMCLVADLKGNEIILDPFAGYGAIPVECAKSFKVNKVMAGEKDKLVFGKLKEKTRNLKPKIILGRWNALNLSALADKNIDRIVTDPPWGIYSHQSDIAEFYQAMFVEFIRVLKDDGLMVILMGQKEMFEEVLSQFKQLKLLKQYDILVSGKKAAIYKIGLKSKGV